MCVNCDVKSKLGELMPHRCECDCVWFICLFVSPVTKLSRVRPTFPPPQCLVGHAAICNEWGD